MSQVRQHRHTTYPRTEVDDLAAVSSDYLDNVG